MRLDHSPNRQNYPQSTIRLVPCSNPIPHTQQAIEHSTVINQPIKIKKMQRRRICQAIVFVGRSPISIPTQCASCTTHETTNFDSGQLPDSGLYLLAG